MDNYTNDQRAVIYLLKKHNRKLNRQDYRTLWGMVKEGRPLEAKKGLQKILIREMKLKNEQND